MEYDRPFMITVRRRWTLWILPVIALLYFLFVVVIAAMNNTVNMGGVNYRILPKAVTLEALALGGLGLFVVVILVEVPFFWRRSGPKRERPRREAAKPQGAAMPAAMTSADDEFVTTSESQQGLRVLEYSAPAKSRNPGAVFAKTYVPVTKEHVLRIETLAASQAEI